MTAVVQRERLAALRRPPSPALAVKRLFDIAVAGTLLVLTLPVQALAGLIVALDDGRPVLYQQQRAGKDGVAFRLRKFRTMRVNSTPPEELGPIAAGHPLVTASGRVLRRLKIDELPQLLSVLSGHMSLVGPRPALPEQAERYDEHERRRLAVAPGMTGWAQVNGNTALEWPDRIVLDIWYVDHWSLWLDVVILARTIAVVIGGERPDPRALSRAHDHATVTRRRG